ncbi:hypothetical protein D3C87_75740 [compost metagenome]
MKYGEQLQKALELVGERDLAEEVTIIWIQDEGDEPDEIPFVDEPDDEEEKEEFAGVESLHDVFTIIDENKPYKVMLRFDDGKEVEIYKDEES